MSEWHPQSAEAIGRLHIRKSLPCQDKTCTMQRNGVTAIALADGAGSEVLSGEGAACAAETVCRLLTNSFDTLYQTETPYLMKKLLIDNLLKALEERAESLNVTIKQLPCTLLAVAVRGNDYLMFHLGDGVIAYRKEGKMLVASHPYNGEYANTTVFLTSPQAIRYAKVFKGTQEKLEGFLLMSDGCERSLYSRKGCKLAPLTDKILQRTELYDHETAEIHLRCLLREIIVPTTMDDCSLAVMTRRQGDLGDWAHMTQRKRADILGIRTQNSSKRRRAIRKYAAVFGIDTGSTGTAL